MSCLAHQYDGCPLESDDLTLYRFNDIALGVDHIPAECKLYVWTGEYPRVTGRWVYSRTSSYLPEYVRQTAREYLWKAPPGVTADNASVWARETFFDLVRRLGGNTIVFFREFQFTVIFTTGADIYVEFIAGALWLVPGTKLGVS